MRRWVWPWELLLLLGLAACNGSGSSGFDGPHTDTLHASRLAENALIAEVIDDAVCLQVETLNVCPPDTRLTPTGGEVATPTTSPTPPNFGCIQPSPGSVCRVLVTFTLPGFAQSPGLWVAARPVHSNDPWHLSDPVMVIDAPRGRRLEAIVEVPAPDSTNAGFLVGLLVVGDPTLTVPTQFDQLEDSGADLAVVTRLPEQP